MREQGPHRAVSFGGEAIVPLFAMPLLRYETGIKQDTKVSGGLILKCPAIALTERSALTKGLASSGDWESPPRCNDTTDKQDCE